MDYPEHLHNELNCYPRASEKVEVTSDMLSTYQKDNYNQLYNRRNDKKFTTMPPFHSQ